MSPSKFTRTACTCSLLGRPKDLCITLLPTYKDILLCCNFERLRLGKLSKSNKEPEFSTIAQIVARKVVNIYHDASIPQVSLDRVLQLINHIHRKYRNIKKCVANKRESDEKKVENFISGLNKHFDISSCKCLEMRNCKCSEQRRIPENVCDFLIDQRTERKLRIPYKFCNKIAVENHYSQVSNSSQSSQSSSDSSSLELNEDSPGFSILEPCKKKHTIKLSKTVIVGQRYGLSDRAIAAISSATLVDHNLVTEDDNTLIVDRNKIRRSKQKVNKVIESCKDEVPIRVLYFDGRKDDSITQIKQGAKYRRISIKEEHVSILSEPGSVYVGHIAPKTSNAEHISRGILDLVLTKGGFEELILIGCDGTAVNTGYKGGIIRLIEKQIKRSVQWSICLLHFNELPFRALFHYIDGRTEGPNSFTGPIGKQLRSCETLPLVHYEKVNFTLPDIDTEDLSTDQKYFLKISKAIQEGKCSNDLSLSQPGCLNHARWLTCANRILRLYVSTPEPSAEFKIVVTYLLKVYVPQWFSIRRKKSIVEGSRHLFEIIRLTRYLPPTCLAVIDKVISRNAFFAMAENILLSMMTDENLSIRKMALEKILAAREEAYSNNVSKMNCKLLAVNFAATTYHEMIDWSVTTYTSPPVLKNINNEELIVKLTSEELFTDWEFCEYPCHTVSVERLVKLVTEASGKVCGMENRNGFIQATLASRRNFTRFDTKKQFPTTSSIEVLK